MCDKEGAPISHKQVWLRVLAVSIVASVVVVCAVSCLMPFKKKTVGISTCVVETKLDAGCGERVLIHVESCVMHKLGLSEGDVRRLARHFLDSMAELVGNVVVGMFSEEKPPRTVKTPSSDDAKLAALLEQGFELEVQALQDGEWVTLGKTKVKNGVVSQQPIAAPVRRKSPDGPAGGSPASAGSAPVE